MLANSEVKGNGRYVQLRQNLSGLFSYKFARENLE